MPSTTDAVINQIDSTLTTPDGETINLPYGGPLPATPTVMPGAHGPTRKIATIPGFRTVRGDLLLTKPSIDPNPQLTDTAELHLGSHLQYPMGSKHSDRADEVDGGLTYGPRGWAVYLNINNSYQRKIPTKRSETKAAYIYQEQLRFTSPAYVNAIYYAYGPNPFTPKRVSLISVQGTVLNGTDLRISIGGTTKLSLSNQDRRYLVLKRVHAIAQSGIAGNPGKSVVTPSFSSWTGVHWGQPNNRITGDAGPGQLLPVNGSTWVLWTANNTYRQGNPTVNFEAGLLFQKYEGEPATTRVNYTSMPANSNEMIDIFCRR